MVLSRPAILGLVAAATAIAVLLVPLNLVGIHDYNVKVEATVSETCFVVCSYSVASVNPTVAGSSSVLSGVLAWLDPSALGLAGPCLNCQYKVTATLSDGQKASVGESKFISNLVKFDYTDTLTLGFAFVPAGSYSVTVTVTLNGGTVATGSGSVCVGC